MLDDANRWRAVILDVRPNGCVKRVVGDQIAIEADIVGDGHEVLRAVVIDRAPGATAWRETELVLGKDDTWRATITAEALGRHRYAVIAWLDRFATWKRGLERKLAAGIDVSLERQEGALLDPNARGLTTRSAEQEVLIERPLAQCSAWYELFPRSFGGLRGAEAQLDYIAELGFDVVYLPPIHPIGRAFRKGPDNAPTAGPNDVGSPWAIGGPEGGHTAIHPALGTMRDFEGFVAAARDRRIEVALDIAFQASPDHPWVKEHPAWFKQRPDGSIQYAENPPKKYQDVYPFDFDSADWKALWTALKDVFIFWCEKGVRVFRVDNPHTKPINFWRWCLREVQTAYPDAIFLAEAFTRPKLMLALADAGFSQSYTYFTWRTAKWEIAEYMSDLAKISDSYRPNFWPTTPDIFPDHLVHGGRAMFVLRAVLASTLSANWGIYGPSYELMEREPRPGVEELAHNEKYEIRAWDLERADSLRHVLARLNRIRKMHPALQTMRGLTFHKTDNDAVIAYSKQRGNDTVLVVANLDPHHTHRAHVELDLAALGISPDDSFQVHDMLGDARYTWRGPRNFVELSPDGPAHVFELRKFIRSEYQFEYFL